jgi:hypothetical protein
MKKFLVTFLFVSIFLPFGCNRDFVPEPQSDEPLTLTSARKWFENTFSSPNARQDTASKTLIWDRAFYHDFSFGKCVVVPVVYKNPEISQYSIKGKKFQDSPKFKISNNDLDFLIIRQNDKKKNIERFVQVVPDQDYLSRSNGRKKRIPFDGLVFIKNWNNKLIGGYKYESGKRVALLTNSQNMRLASSLNLECETTDWFTCVSADHGGSWMCRYTHSSTDCLWAPQGSDGSITPPPNEDYDCVEFSSGGGDIIQTANDYFLSNYRVIGPDIPINIVNKLNCFGSIPNDPKYKYKVTVYVDQPVYNSRDVVNLSLASRKPGHTYLGFERLDQNTGEVIRVVAGFYVQSEATAASLVYTTSAWGDDGNTPYDASLNVDVSAAQFKNIVDLIKHNPNPDYHLVANNCTTVACETVSQYIGLPSGQSWIGPLGIGYNPGALTQDLRDLKQNPQYSNKITVGNNLTSPSTTNCN